MVILLLVCIVSSGAITHSSQQPVSGIIRNLVEHGCPEVTNLINVQGCTEWPVSSGGFGDVYQGKMFDTTQVAIKCARLFIGSNDSNKILKVHILKLLRIMLCLTLVIGLPLVLGSQAICMVKVQTSKCGGTTWTGSVSWPNSHGISLDGEQKSSWISCKEPWCWLLSAGEMHISLA